MIGHVVLHSKIGQEQPHVGAPYKDWVVMKSALYVLRGWIGIPDSITCKPSRSLADSLL